MPSPKREDDHGAPITLLYVRSPDLAPCDLDDILHEVAARYAPMVALVVIDPADLDIEHGGRVLASSSPAVIVLRGDEVVGNAVGARLPAREIDRVVRRAVEQAA